MCLLLQLAWVSLLQEPTSLVQVVLTHQAAQPRLSEPFKPVGVLHLSSPVVGYSNEHVTKVKPIRAFPETFPAVVLGEAALHGQAKGVRLSCYVPPACHVE